MSEPLRLGAGGGGKPLSPVFCLALLSFSVTLTLVLVFDSMSRTTPTKQQLNQTIRADIPGGDYLLDLFNYLHIIRRYNLTDECHGFLDFIYNRLKSIRARMREAVIDKTDPTLACKVIADEVIQDLRNRLKDPRYCKRKKLKADHIEYCKKFRDALVGFMDVLEGRRIWVDGELVEAT